MAKPVKLSKGKKITFAPPRSGARGQYDWDRWFNPDPHKFPEGLVLLEQSLGEKDESGNVVNVTEKRDFSMSPKFMVLKIRGAARRRFKIVQVTRNDADGNRMEDAIIIQARDMTEDEKHIERVRRSDRKLAKLKKKEAAEAKAQGAPSATAVA